MNVNRGNEYEKKTIIFLNKLKKAKIKSYIIIREQTNLKKFFKNYPKTVYNKSDTWYNIYVK